MKIDFLQSRFKDARFLDSDKNSNQAVKVGSSWKHF